MRKDILLVVSSRPSLRVNQEKTVFDLGGGVQRGVKGFVESGGVDADVDVVFMVE